MAPCGATGANCRRRRRKRLMEEKRERENNNQMPVRMIAAEPAEWPAHLAKIGEGAPFDKPWADEKRKHRKEVLEKYALLMREKRTPTTRIVKPVAASVRRGCPRAEAQRAVALGREMERILLDEAEEAVRMKRLRRVDQS